MNTAQQEYKRWLSNVVETDKPALNALTDVDSAFAQELTFGTGGLRGKLGMGTNRLNVYTVGKATQGLANYLTENFDNPTVAICYDSRIMSREFAEHTACVMAANGVVAYLSNELQPTPFLSYVVRELGCSAGVCITASHNPAEYNGYKVYGSDGNQITVGAAKDIQAHIRSVDVFNDVKASVYQEASSNGLIKDIPVELLDAYAGATLKQSTGVDCTNLKVAYTPLNGTGIKFVKRVLGAEGTNVAELHVVENQAQPDGGFPTCPYPNPEASEAMQLGEKLMLEKGCDLLIATDPDADRVGVAVPVGENAYLLTGNELGLLLLDFLATQAKSAGKNMSRQVVGTTIVSSPMADDIARAYGFELRRTLTGFKFICEQAGFLADAGRENDFMMGFEESCGYLRGTHVRDKDGIVTAMLACEMAAYYKAQNQTLYDALVQLYECFSYWRDEHVSITFDGNEAEQAMARLRAAKPQSLGGCAVKRTIDYANGVSMPVVNPAKGSTLQTLPVSDVLEYRLEGGNKIIVRPSGTEPKLKAYVFTCAKTRAQAEEDAKALTVEVEALLKSMVFQNAKMQKPFHIILLSGGSGTRLWPLSNDSRSKQFLKVLRDEEGNHVSMVQRAFAQIERVLPETDVTVATCAAQERMLKLQIGSNCNLSIEPSRRDTAPAIMLACEHLASEQNVKPDEVCVVMPIDSFVEDTYFEKLREVADAVEANVADMVLLGVEPTYPSEKYGYIVPTTPEGSPRLVSRFTEKPSADVATQLVEQGALWNNCVFGFRLGHVLDIVKQYGDFADYADLSKRYAELPKNSFDYEVVEKAESVAVVPYAGSWKDLGTWNTLTEEMADSASGNTVLDEQTSSGTYVINELDIPVVVSGIKDAVVVATLDGILVCSKEESVHLKELVAKTSSHKA